MLVQKSVLKGLLILYNLCFEVANQYHIILHAKCCRDHFLEEIIVLNTRNKIFYNFDPTQGGKFALKWCGI